MPRRRSHCDSSPAAETASRLPTLVAIATRVAICGSGLMAGVASRYGPRAERTTLQRPPRLERPPQMRECFAVATGAGERRVDETARLEPERGELARSLVDHGATQRLVAQD